MKYISILIVLAGVIGVALSLYLMPPDSGKPLDVALENFIRHDKPRPLPDIVFSIEGQETRLSALQAATKSEIMVINFWATWCAPCRREMPQLDALQAYFTHKPITVLALSLDRGEAEKPLAFLKELGVRHLIAAHDGSFKAGRDVRIQGLPTTLIINKDGAEIGRLAGEADWASPAVITLLEALLES